MALRLFKTMWGVTEFTVKSPNRQIWKSTLQQIKQDGFDGVELCINQMEEQNLALFNELRKEIGLDLIANIHTCSYPIGNQTMQDHVQSFQNLLEQSAQLDPVMVNSHSGKDSFDRDTAVKFFNQCLEIENKYKFPVVHETHRQRILYNPWITQDIMDTIPNLKINLDLSHFIVVSERIFDEQLDPEWTPVMNKLSNRCYQIHARIGSEQSPQLSDPRAPEFSKQVTFFENCWKQIWQEQRNLGKQSFNVTCEFGPAPYNTLLPYSQMPLADIWEINKWQAQRLRKMFNE